MGQTSSNKLTSTNNQQPDIVDVQGVKIEVVQGDITEEDTEAIINPTDNKLSLDGAISKKIVEKGGQQIVSDCAKLGTLKEVAMTKATGQLKCKHLVHVLVPQNSKDWGTIIINLLLLVNRKGLHSLSIPFIGPGGSEIPRDNMADDITRYVVCMAHQGSLNNLKTLRLVGFTLAEKTLFKNALYKWMPVFSNIFVKNPPAKQSPPIIVADHIPDSPISSSSLTKAPIANPLPVTAKQSPPIIVADHIPDSTISSSSLTKAPIANPLPVTSASNSQAPATHTPTLSKNLNGVTFEVALGDITDEQTDAIVNPTDDELQLDGKLSKWIVSKGGSVINEECRTRGSIPAGGTVVTTGGALSCRHVVHVESPDDLQECERAVRAIIQSAVANKFKSISFPPIGAGGKGQPLNPVAGCIVDTLSDAAEQNITGSLTFVRLVGFTAPEEAAFKSALTSTIQRKQNLSSASANSSITLDSDTNLIEPLAHPTTSSNTPQPVTAASLSANNGTVINGISIEVLQGDVTDESTDAIVNPTDEDMELTGNLSQAILAKGGQSIKSECKATGTLKDVVLTSAGSLKCHHIVHAHSPGNITECKKVVPAILRLCASKQFKSIAIPLIGASRGKPLDQMAKCIADEVVNEVRNGTLRSITLVRLVGFNQNEKDAFDSALKLSAANISAVDVSAKMPPPSTSIPPIQGSPNGSVINGVFVEVLHGDITIESTEAIVNPTDEDLELTGKLSKALIAKGGASITDECKTIGKLNDVAITSAGNGSLQCRQIIHILSPKNISACQRVVRSLLATVATKGIASVAIPPIGVTLGIKLDYVAGCITDEVASAARGKTLGVLKHVRLVGFNQSEKDAFDWALKLSAAQTSALDAAKNSSLAAVKVVAPQNALAVNLPVTWASMDTSQSWSQVPMQQSDADYSDALKLFTLKGKTIHKIFRIQNPTFYGQYQLEKTNMEKQYVGKAGKHLKTDSELHLYHGTEEAIVPKICAKGFDRRYCGKNAVCYGRGSYFARDMDYSAQDTYSKPKAVTGEKYIFAVRVLVGVFQEGKDDQQVPDAQPSGEPYDATVDDEDEPTIFVIYRDTRAYPEFLYVFT